MTTSPRASRSRSRHDRPALLAAGLFLSAPPALAILTERDAFEPYAPAVALGVVFIAGALAAGVPGTGRQRFWRVFAYAASCAAALPLAPAIPGAAPMWLALLYGGATGACLAFALWPPGRVAAAPPPAEPPPATNPVPSMAPVPVEPAEPRPHTICW